MGMFFKVIALLVVAREIGLFKLIERIFGK